VSVVVTDNALRRLLEAGRALVSELDVEAVLERVLVTAAEVTGARYAALGVLDEHRRELERFVTHGIPESAHHAIGELPRGRGLLGAVIADPRPLRTGSIAGDSRSFGFPDGHPRMENFLGVPVLIRGAAWGNL
jgi:GAF domain-containing protein